MKDFRKYCRPKTTLNPKYGDKIITLNCGELVYVDALEFERVKGFYNNVSNYVYKDKADAAVGDIVVEGNKIVSLEEFNLQDKKAKGIIFLNSTNAPDGKARMVSLDYMDYNNPIEGNSGTGVSMVWGASGNIAGLNNLNQVPCLSGTDNVRTSEVLRAISYGYIPTDYFTTEVSDVSDYGYSTGPASNGLYCPSMFLSDGSINPQAVMTKGTVPGTSTIFTVNNALADFDGENNTKKILEYVVPGSKLDTTIANSSEEGHYPAALVCSLYKDGSWYLPAEGELACLVSNFKLINSSRTFLGYRSYSYNSYWFWSSTLYSSTLARSVYGYYGLCTHDSRSSTSSTSRVLAVSAF